MSAEIKKVVNQNKVEKMAQRLNELCHYQDYTQLLTNETGVFHPTHEKISTFEKNSNEVKKIVKILQIPFSKQNDWMCEPFYRDAIVFYKQKNEPVSILNICFECEVMQIDKQIFITGDVKIYKKLRRIMKSFGHKIENY